MNDNYSTYTICNNFDEKHKLDDNITHLKFGNYFSKILRKNDLPSKLTHLIFNDNYNEYIDKKVLPKGLTHLWFGDSYNRLIDKKVLPTTLFYLKFGLYYNKPFTIGVIPDGLQELVIGKNYNCVIKKNVLPDNLNKLYLITYDAAFEDYILPTNLKFLSISLQIKTISKHYKILLNNLPCELEELTICSTFRPYPIGNFININENEKFDLSCLTNLPPCLKKISTNFLLLDDFIKIPFGCEIIYINYI